MKRGRPTKKTEPMQQQSNDANPFSNMEEGDKVNSAFQIERVSNGYIIVNKLPGTKTGVMVFNGKDGHNLVIGHILALALVQMKEGEIITFNSQLEYNKKIQL